MLTKWHQSVEQKNRLKHQYWMLWLLRGYRRINYIKNGGDSGHASKTFRSCIDELTDKEEIRYAAENKQDSNIVLVIIGKFSIFIDI